MTHESETFCLRAALIKMAVVYIYIFTGVMWVLSARDIWPVITLTETRSAITPIEMPTPTTNPKGHPHG